MNYITYLLHQYRKRRGCLKRHFTVVSGSPWLKASIIIYWQSAEPPFPSAPPNPVGVRWKRPNGFDQNP